MITVTAVMDVMSDKVGSIWTVMVVYDGSVCVTAFLYSFYDGDSAPVALMVVWFAVDVPVSLYVVVRASVWVAVWVAPSVILVLGDS